MEFSMRRPPDRDTPLFIKLPNNSIAFIVISSTTTVDCCLLSVAEKDATHDRLSQH
jgi:hypothetical protein